MRCTTSTMDCNPLKAMYKSLRREAGGNESLEAQL
jgi:hypothetical protein